MTKIENVIILEVESGKDKNAETEGGKYRRDSPWLVEAFQNKGINSSIIFISKKDTVKTLIKNHPKTYFLGRVNPMDYEEISFNEYLKLLEKLRKKKLLVGPNVEHISRLGSKMVLYELRKAKMGSNDVVLHKYKKMNKNKKEIDKVIPLGGPPRVIKMMKGSTGLGVWKLENKDDDTLIVINAYDQSTQEMKRNEVLQRFIKLSKEDAISMPFFPLIKEGEFRFLLSRHKVLDIVHKKPMDSEAFTATLKSGAVYTAFEVSKCPDTVSGIESWSHEIKKVLGLKDVPYWWSIDCIEDDCTDFKENDIPSCNPDKKLILSEINCTCLGLVADTSPEAKAKGLKLAEFIAEIILS